MRVQRILVREGTACCISTYAVAYAHMRVHTCKPTAAKHKNNHARPPPPPGTHLFEFGQRALQLLLPVRQLSPTTEVLPLRCTGVRGGSYCQAPGSS